MFRWLGDVLKGVVTNILTGVVLLGVAYFFLQKLF